MHICTLVIIIRLISMNADSAAFTLLLQSLFSYYYLVIIRWAYSYLVCLIAHVPDVLCTRAH